MKVKGTSNEKHDNCELADKGTNPEGLRKFYCLGHQQWTYVFPIRKTYSYPAVTELPDVTM